MTLPIRRADFTDPRLAAFVQDHLDDLAPTAPDESRHALALTALQESGVRMWVVDDGERILGTAALASLEPGHEELKTMRTAPHARGRGIARQMLVHLIDDAERRGISRLSLETGSMGFFAPARALYLSAGFEMCEPFASYAADPNSTFMTRDLTRRTGERAPARTVPRLR